MAPKRNISLAYNCLHIKYYILEILFIYLLKKFYVQRFLYKMYILAVREYVVIRNEEVIVLSRGKEVNIRKTLVQ